MHWRCRSWEPFKGKQASKERGLLARARTAKYKAEATEKEANRRITRPVKQSLTKKRKTSARATRHHNKTDKRQQIDSVNMTWRKGKEEKGTKDYTRNDKRADQQVQKHRACSNMAVHVLDSSLGQNVVEGEGSWQNTQ